MKPRVLIEVRGGVAYVTSEGVDILHLDYDLNEVSGAEGDSYGHMCIVSSTRDIDKPSACEILRMASQFDHFKELFEEHGTMVVDLPGSLLNKFQMMVKDVYAGGEYSHVKSREDYESDDIGDGLFKFIMAELADLEPNENGNMNHAVMRMTRACIQILEFSNALTEAYK